MLKQSGACYNTWSSCGAPTSERRVAITNPSHCTTVAAVKYMYSSVYSRDLGIPSSAPVSSLSMAISDAERDLYLSCYRSTYIADRLYAGALDRALDHFRSDFHNRDASTTSPPIFLGRIMQPTISHINFANVMTNCRHFLIRRILSYSRPISSSSLPAQEIAPPPFHSSAQPRHPERCKQAVAVWYNLLPSSSSISPVMEAKIASCTLWVSTRAVRAATSLSTYVCTPSSSLVQAPVQSGL